MSDLRAAVLLALETNGRQAALGRGLRLTFTPAECYGRPFLTVTGPGRRPNEAEVRLVAAALRQACAAGLGRLYVTDPLGDELSRNIYWRP